MLLLATVSINVICCRRNSVGTQHIIHIIAPTVERVGRTAARGPLCSHVGRSYVDDTIRQLDNLENLRLGDYIYYISLLANFYRRHEHRLTIDKLNEFLRTMIRTGPTVRQTLDHTFYVVFLRQKCIMKRT